jgi:hypothetical protein
MVDDDMYFTADQAQEIVAVARATNTPTSAAYVLANGVLAASHYRGNRWQTGLGFLAIPAHALDALSYKSPKFRAAKDVKEWTFEFTESRPIQSMNGELVWEPEDYCFTRRLGGVLLLPVCIGHIKKKVLQAGPLDKLKAMITDAEKQTPTS